MALILEVLEGRGVVRTRIRLDALPLPVHIGRGLDNDVILDDPYVDVQHARITRGTSGEVILEDLASTNGVTQGRARERVTRVAVAPGTELRVGRTLVRFRDSAEAVAPALVDVAGGTPVAPEWAENSWAQVALSIVSLALIGVNFWLDSYERDAAAGTFATVLGIAALVAVWSGIWAVAGRFVAQRFRFITHFALFSFVLLMFFVWAAITEWAAFLFPDNTAAGAVTVVLSLAMVAAVVVAHLGLASALPARRRWKIGAAVSMVIVALVSVSALTAEDTFTDVPEFATTVKAIGAGWLPTHSVAEFGDVTAELQNEVDALLEK